MSSSASPLFPQVGVMALVPDRWGPEWQARHYIVSRLTRYFQVLWVENPPSWRALFSPAEKVSAAVPFPAPFPVYNPGLSLPDFGRPVWLAHLSLRERLRRAAGKLRQRGCTRLVVYMWRPRFAAVLHRVPHDLSCYHIDDEYSFSTEERAVDPEERYALQTVGQVFIHSPAMMAKKGSFNPHTDLIPNGVDFERYAAPMPEPEDLRSIPRPRIGYAGVLKRQLDWLLLRQLAERHPQWSFVFAGGVNPNSDPGEPLRALSALPNVHLLGAKSTLQLMPYPQHFDVCMLPYRIDGYTRYIYPLKLHECLAGGAPVVGSRIPSLQDFSDVILLAGDVEEWERALAAALTGDTPLRRQARQAVARRHDWQILVGRIAHTILQRLAISPAPDRQQLPPLSAALQEAELKR